MFLNLRFASHYQMPKAQKSYNIYRMASALLMVVALAWLTVSAPFVYASQQQAQKSHSAIENNNPVGGHEEEAPNPLNNTPEEKKPGSNNSFAEEFLHDLQSDDYLLNAHRLYHRAESGDDYIAFHGELLVPPPNQC
jgi:hypothetical protein